MNFFGHAAVACWRSEAPCFVLGAMLPDFAGMIRARPPAAHHGELSDGIAFHHATDHAFHDSVTFRSLTARANAELTARGLRRGSARAAAHVGVEILLDTTLARDPRARNAYRAALLVANEPVLGLQIAWRDQHERDRFTDLCRVLESRGISAEHVDPDLVALRLSRALAGRPRLELDAGNQHSVSLWAADALALIVESAPALLEELRRALST